MGPPTLSNCWAEGVSAPKVKGVLSSATDHRDTPVRAVVSQPLFSSDHTLILPEGARLDGTIMEAVPARLFGRNGQLRFTFRQLELTPGATRKV